MRTDLRPFDDPEYLQSLGTPADEGGEGYTLVYPMGDGRWAGIRRLLFHWTLHTGFLWDRSGYDDRYCIATEELAIRSLEEWKERDFEGEPDYWHRHPRTARRRTDGDPAKEYISG